jgi:hypothetical protein
MSNIAISKPHRRSSARARFDKHTFTLREYLSLTEHDGVMRAFRTSCVVETH